MNWKYIGENKTNNIVKNTIKQQSKNTENAVIEHAKHMNKNIKNEGPTELSDLLNHT